MPTRTRVPEGESQDLLLDEKVDGTGRMSADGLCDPPPPLNGGGDAPAEGHSAKRVLAGQRNQLHTSIDLAKF
jgi:hypothetical protein